MSTSIIYEGVCKSEEELMELGKKTSSILQKGVPVFLFGDIGVGKTCFTRGLIRSFVNNEKIIVNSPSFVLQKSYKNKITNNIIHHYDLYRLGTVENIMQIGVDSVIKNGYTVLEWPELIYKLYSNRIDVWIQYNKENTDRFVTIKTLFHIMIVL
ncbi:hypothetical protein WA158_003397 [Blastocystis sp. Blastoise]